MPHLRLPSAALAALLAALLLPLPSRAAEPPRPVAVTARAIASFGLFATGTRYGRLDYRGGIQLVSPDADFGGLSGFTLDAAGTRFVAVSDKGQWFAGTLIVEGDRPLGVGNVVTAPILGADGRPLKAQRRQDVEALARTPDGYAIGIERRHEIWRFKGADPLAARGQQVKTGKALAGLNYNEGVEALVAAGVEGRPALIAVAEVDPEDPSFLPGFIVRADGKVDGFHIGRTEAFKATDMTLAPDGHLYLLERSYSPLTGVGMRIRRFPLGDVKRGAWIEGEVMLEIGMSANIDNMEAIASHRNAAGETVLTVVSDDNFSARQRTLLLRFAVVE